MNIIDINTSAPADRLGKLLAQIADLTKQADAIKDEFKDEATLPGGDKVFVGNLFKATVVEANRKTVDNAALYAELGVTDEQIARHTKVTASFSVRCVSR
jgi:hypothetical protein